jgi:hypothetical protein
LIGYSILNPEILSSCNSNKKMVLIWSLDAIDDYSSIIRIKIKNNHSVPFVPSVHSVGYDCSFQYRNKSCLFCYIRLLQSFVPIIQIVMTKGNDKNDSIIAALTCRFQIIEITNPYNCQRDFPSLLINTKRCLD